MLQSRPGGEIGRRASLRCWWAQALAGSNPVPGIISHANRSSAIAKRRTQTRQVNWFGDFYSRNFSFSLDKISIQHPS